jgi:thymidylate synthase
MNANDNLAWLNNPYRKGEDDMGRVYGVQGRSWQKSDGSTIDQLRKIVDNLSEGIDDRGEILTFYNPGEFDMGCLRPCMHTHTFSLLGDTLYLTSYQRSCDVPLGLNFNQVQVYTLLALMAQITGKKPGLAYHKIINAHIYEDQLSLLRDVQLTRTPFASPKLIINPKIKSLEDLETWVTMDDFEVIGYEHHEAIKYPFSV